MCGIGDSHLSLPRSPYIPSRDKHKKHPHVFSRRVLCLQWGGAPTMPGLYYCHRKHILRNLNHIIEYITFIRPKTMDVLSF